MMRDEEQMRVERKIADFMAYARMRHNEGKVPRSEAMKRVAEMRETTIKRMEAKYPDFRESYEKFIEK